jgi:HlyD family type I secretion membrane fusion protein
MSQEPQAASRWLELRERTSAVAGSTQVTPGELAPLPPVQRYVLAAFVVLVVFFGGFGVWAALAPLQSAAIAPGRVTVASHRKTVEHLEGGIIAALLVKEGDVVTAGQLLIRLDATRAEATLQRLHARYDALVSTEARLAAERDWRDFVSFPDSLLNRGQNPETLEILSGQQAIFEARRKALRGRVDILNQRIAQLHDEINALQAQVEAEVKQLRLIRQETDTVEKLVRGGLAEMPRLLALQRTSADIEGRRGEKLALIARAEQRIGETKLQILDLENNFQSEVVTELRTTQAEAVDILGQLKSAEDVVNRTQVLAPLAGVVVNLRVHTTGGVANPGEPLLDIVPRDDVLVVESRIDPLDIDVVRVGLPATVRLTAFKARHIVPLAASVTHVSADSFTDERSGAPYYMAQVTIDPTDRQKLKDLELYPGMPAEVMIATGERTALDYALRPVLDSFGRAFRED